jgi:hypothetical protein
MPAKDPFAANDKYGIRPSWMYRKHHAETIKIIGLGPTAIEEAIDDGLLDRPVPLTSHGKAKGWWGWMLISYMERRIAAAQQQVAPPSPPTTKKKRRAGAFVRLRRDGAADSDHS